MEKVPLQQTCRITTHGQTLRKDGVRSRHYRDRYKSIALFFFSLTIWFIIPCLFLKSLEAQSPPSHPLEKIVKNTLAPALNLNESEDAEPDITSWWKTVNAIRDNVSMGTECESLFARQGMSVSLLPACQVSGGTNVTKPLCVEKELDAFVGGNVSTKAYCVERGYQKKCYVENIILKKGTFFTYKGKHSGVPSTMYLADGTTGPLLSNHKYHGTPVREIAPPAELGQSILNHCKYVVNRPVVFLFRMSGHSTYHLWENNLGPFFDTLHDDFGIPKQDSGEKKRSTRTRRNDSSDVFDGQVPLIITVDRKPREGHDSPRLLDELLHYFTSTPIMDAAEFTDATCFAKAVIGISSGRFNQGMLLHWLFPRVALRHRLMQLYREAFPSALHSNNAQSTNMAQKTTLRCLVPYEKENEIPPVIGHWFAWKLRQWRRRPSQPSVLYLSRNHPNIVRGRKVVNEADVLPALEETVLNLTGKPLLRLFLEQMPYVDQIMTMSEVNILIAPHGGGIANCVWMPPGSIVVEFVAPAGATLPNMYHRMCRRPDGNRGMQSAHIPFVAAQDPAELEPGFAAANVIWNSNRRLFSNIWLPKDKFLELVHQAIQLYQRTSLAKTHA